VDRALLDRLAGIVGPAALLTGVDRSPYVIEGRTPEAVVQPTSREQVAALLRLASAEGLPVTPWGGGTKMAIGAPPARAGLVLALGRLNRLVEHEPGDLTATVEAGMTFGALQAALGQRGQWVALDPAYPERATVGGILATNAAGPRRHLHGTSRDLVIGLTVVTADGAVVRGGGRVVKNVAGYDLPKLYVGSFGTLGVLVEATVKLSPRPEAEWLVVVPVAGLAQAAQAAGAIMASALVPAALEVLDPRAAARLGVAEGPAVLVGVDGMPEQVAWQSGEVGRVVGDLALGPSRVLEGEPRERVWREVTEFGAGTFDETAAVMRWAVLPTHAADTVEEAGRAARVQGLGAAFAVHWGAGIVTAVLTGNGADTGGTAAALQDWRTLVNARGGQARLEWAPLAVKERVAVWDDPGPAHRMMRRIKEQLDPRGILNPGRFVGGL
jgi:glycolate oxidase FAD binding subunit